MAVPRSKGPDVPSDGTGCVDGRQCDSWLHVTVGDRRQALKSEASVLTAT